MSSSGVSRWPVVFAALVVAGVGPLAGGVSFGAPADLTASQQRNGAFALVDGDVYGFTSVLDAYEKDQLAGLPAGAMVKLASGKSSSCGLTSDGSVFCWGRPRFGQLGPGTFVNDDTALKVTGVPRAVDVAVGYHHACLVGGRGAVWCWGLNDEGQLGSKPSDPQSQPAMVEGIPEPVRRIDAELNDTCAVTQADDVYCWGDNALGQLGTGAQSAWELPSRVRHLPNGARSSAVGGGHTCALTTTGVVRCWGLGVLVTGQYEPSVLLTPTRIDDLGPNVRRIAADWSHSCALRHDNLFCWGRNNAGELGGGRGNDAFLQKVEGGPEHVGSFTLGWSQTCATSQDGRLWCWGDESSPEGRSFTPDRVSGYFAGYVAQPDSLVDTASGWIGRDTYNTTGRDQTVHRTLEPTEVRRVRIRVVNDGDARDVIRLDAERVAPGIRLDAKVDGADRREQLLAGELRWNLAPGESRELILIYSAGPDVVAGLDEQHRVVARSSNDGMFSDAARIAIVVG